MGNGPKGAGGAASVAWIAAVASITILDGFDAFSLSLMAPWIGRELHIPTAALGPIFASSMGGMTVGAIAGGALADKVGRLRTLLVALALFGVAALTMPLVTSAGTIILNRLCAGVGLGAAAPIAVSLLNRSGEKPPSEFAIALGWSGIPVGGSLAALFNYMFVADYGWRLIFVVGGLLPLPVAIFAYAVFRGVSARPPGAGEHAPPGLSGLFAHGQALRTLTVAGMFFFGYVMTSVIVYWLPTILSHRAASPLMIAVAFGAINGGGVLGILLLGWLATIGHSGQVRTLAWAAASICGLGAAVAALSTPLIALLAIGAATIGGGGQALSVALANEMHRERGLQTTSVGFMTGAGRTGQFCALSISGAVVTVSGQETLVFGLAGVAAGVAALLSIIAARPARAC